jgi:hypothetical protein
MQSISSPYQRARCPPRPPLPILDDEFGGDAQNDTVMVENLVVIVGYSQPVLVLRRRLDRQSLPPTWAPTGR